MFKIHSAEKHANSNEKAEHEASQLSDKLSSFLCSFSSGSICSPVLLQMIEPQLQGGSPLGKGKALGCSSDAWAHHAEEVNTQGNPLLGLIKERNCPISTRSLKMKSFKGLFKLNAIFQINYSILI